ncbi:MAG: hypothetical protein IRZ32_02180 [Solirubrobacteraceae bacterium]|nr:hypothetical protein [Solirubrobacteraceae bacterium]
MFADTLPGDQGSAYVAAAYLFFLALLLVYLAIMGVRVARMRRELSELEQLTRERRDAPPASEQEPERLPT